MLTTTTLAVLALVMAAAVATPFNNCTEGQPTILKLDIEGCDESPCPLSPGDSLLADVLFHTGWATKTLTPQAIATAFGIEVEYPLPETDACKSLLLAECPLEPGERITYHLSMALPPIPFKMLVPVQLSLLDDNEKAMACFSVDVQIV